MSSVAWYWKLLFVAAILFGLNAAKGFYDAGKIKQGWDDRDRTARETEARIEAAGARKLAEKTTAAAVAERALRDRLDAEETKRKKENVAYEKSNAALLARVRAGDERLSIAVRCDAVPRIASAQNSGATSGPGAETRADLLPGTVERIFSIAGRAAVDVRDYNAVVDAYNLARETCNAE